MTETEIELRVRRAVADLAEIDVVEIDVTTDLSWLAFNDVDKGLLMQELEHQLGIEPPEGGIAGLETVQDVIDHVLSQLRQQA